MTNGFLWQLSVRLNDKVMKQPFRDNQAAFMFHSLWVRKKVAMCRIWLNWRSKIHLLYFIVSEEKDFKQTVTCVCFSRFQINHRASAATYKCCTHGPDVLWNKTWPRPKGHVLYLCLNTHTHTCTDTISCMSFTQHLWQRRGQPAPSYDPVKTIQKQLNLSSIIRLPGDHRLHRHYLHVVICQQH